MFIGIAINLTARLLSSASPAALFANGEVGLWYDPSDLTTLFQDSAGTTPVTAAGQPVGLMLDKSKGLVLGSELWSDTGVIVGTGWTVASGVYTHTAGVDTFRKDIGLVAGKTYQVTFTVTGRTAGNIGPVYGGSVNGPTVTANGTYTQRVASGTNALLYFQPSTDFVGSVSGISVREIAGNHATQATAASRPTYGINPITGTRNLLTFTEQFDNAIWVKSNATVSSQAVSGPDGNSITASLVTATASGGWVGQYFTSSAGVSSFYFDIKKGSSSTVTFKVVNIQDALTYNFDTGVIGGLSAANGIATNLGNGWVRLSVWLNTGATVNYGPAISPDTNGGTVYVRASQFEIGSTATAYQRVTTKYDVTEAGVQSVQYLQFDGVDDGMVTNTITPAIDKVQVFAGVRKLSDAAQGMFAELSSSATANNGAFFVVAPAANATADYAWRSKGTVAVTCISAATYVAPITNVMAGIGDISGDISTLRINSLHVETKTADQGTGNYLAYPLYIGRRGGTTLPFNGRLYSLIVRFGPNLTDGQITSTENWVNGKTGAY